MHFSLEAAPEHNAEQRLWVRRSIRCLGKPSASDGNHIDLAQILRRRFNYFPKASAPRAGIEARGDFRPQLDADIFTTWNAAGAELRAVLFNRFFGHVLLNKKGRLFSRPFLRRLLKDQYLATTGPPQR
jgi:hypothetical protein